MKKILIVLMLYLVSIVSFGQQDSISTANPNVLNNSYIPKVITIVVNGIPCLIDWKNKIVINLQGQTIGTVVNYDVKEGNNVTIYLDVPNTIMNGRNGIIIRDGKAFSIFGTLVK